MKPQQNDIGVGDTVYFLKYARKERGKVTKINKKTYKIDISDTPISCYGGPLEFNVEKFKVAHCDDVCTIVCDYQKDPNGMSVAFTYDEALQTHKPLNKWSTQSAYFVGIF